MIKVTDMHVIKNMLYRVVMLLCGSLLLLTSCNRDDRLTALSKGEGTLAIGSLRVDNLIAHATRADGTYEAPSVDDLIFRITSATNGEIAFQDTGAVSSVILKQDAYLLEVYYGAELMSVSTPFLYYQQTFSITPNHTTTLDHLTVGLACAIIRPDFSDELLAQLDITEMKVTDAQGQWITVQNRQDCFVPEQGDYTLTVVGKNGLGEEKQYTVAIATTERRQRYCIQREADLPAFTLPQQQAGHVWSRQLYITPMTPANITRKPEMADTILQHIVYEVSADGTSWQPAVQENETWCVRGLQPSTTYTLRARFGRVICDNPYTFTTEGAQPLVNGSLDEWTSTQLYSGNGTWSASLYCDYCTGWNTRNELTTKGAEGASAFSNYGTTWRWRSGTLYAPNGSGRAAQLSTLAFYNQSVKGGWSRDEVLSYTQNDGTAYVAYLFLGTFDKNTDTYHLGIPHTSRPLSLSFDYRYVPVEGDRCLAYAKVYDENHREIAGTGDFHSVAQEEYRRQQLTFDYTDTMAKAAYITIFFQSGTDTDRKKMQLYNGSYSISPFNQDYVAGSQLFIDNVMLHYE